MAVLWGSHHSRNDAFLESRQRDGTVKALDMRHARQSHEASLQYVAMMKVAA